MADRSDATAPARRVILQGIFAAMLAPLIEGCGSGPGPVTANQPPLPPLATSPLSSLVAAAGVRWLLVAAPRDLLRIAWIPPLVDVAVSGARFERFAQTTGIDLRTLPEAIVAAFAPAPSKGGAAAAPRSDVVGGGATASKGDVAGAGAAATNGDGASPPKPDAASGDVADPLALAGNAAAEDDDVMFYLARHTGDAQAIERSYRARFTSAEKRAVERPDLIRVSGKVGQRQSAAVFLGRDVAGFQDGGSASRGPARVAALTATPPASTREQERVAA